MLQSHGVSATRTSIMQDCGYSVGFGDLYVNQGVNRSLTTVIMAPFIRGQLMDRQQGGEVREGRVESPVSFEERMRNRIKTIARPPVSFESGVGGIPLPSATSTRSRQS
jgi:hypothetical protein